MPDPTGRSTLPAPVSAPSPVLDPDAVRQPVTHQLPPHRGKVGRITDHVAAVSADLREWVELRIDLAKVEINDKKDEVVGQAKRVGVGVGFLAGAGVVALYLVGFLFAAIAVGIGWAFAAEGSAVLRPLFWGLLIVNAILLLITGVLALVGKNKMEAAKAIDAKLKAPEYSEANETASMPPTRPQLQDLEARHARQTTT